MLAILVVLASVFPAGLEDKADPLTTPAHIKPEWYFLSVYQLLKLVPRLARDHGADRRDRGARLPAVPRPQPGGHGCASGRSPSSSRSSPLAATVGLTVWGQYS